MRGSDKSYLFNDPGNGISGICRIFEYTLKIFASQWPTFLAISFFQALSVAILSVVFAIALAFVYIGTNRSSTSYSGARFLLDYTDAVVGSSASRLLSDYDDIDDGTSGNSTSYDDVITDDDVYSSPDSLLTALIEMGPGSVLGILIFMISLWAVQSVFQGALVRAAAENYVGFSSEVSLCLKSGADDMMKIFCFNLIFLAAVTVVGLLFVVAPSFVTQSGSALVTTSIFYFVFCIVASSVIVGGVPSIVVEKKSPTSAFQRSWSLCKGSICFIFNPLFWFHMIDWSLYAYIKSIFGSDSVGSLLQFILNIFLVPLGTILVVVLYMTLRIRSEVCTQSSLSQELSVSPPLLDTAPGMPPSEKIVEAECA